MKDSRDMVLARDAGRADGIRHALAVLDLCALAGLGLRDVVALARSGKSLEAIRADLLERRNRAPDIRGQHVGFGPVTAGLLVARMSARYSKGE